MVHFNPEPAIFETTTADFVLMESLAHVIARFKPGDPVTPAVLRSTGSST